MELSVSHACTFPALNNLFSYSIENNKCHRFDERSKLLVWVTFDLLYNLRLHSKIIWSSGVYLEDSKILRLITIFVRSCFNLEPDDSQRNSSPYCYSYMHLSYLNLLCQSQGGYSITNLNQ